MTTIIKAIMSGLLAATALAVVSTSASALSPRDLGIPQTPIVQESQQLDRSPAVHRALWSDQDQQSFWNQQEDRGG